MRSDLGQYYTHQNISKLLMSNILMKNPKKILELGIGDGALLREAKLKWRDSKIIGGDIDPKNIKILKKEFPNVDLFLINGLSSRLNHRLKIKLGSIDVGVCNPPYLVVEKSDEIKKILNSSRLGDLSDYRIVTSDLVFLAQNLLLIRENGELGIILPDGLLTSHQFSMFRKRIIENYSIKGIIELPDKIFLVGNPGLYDILNFLIKYNAVNVAERCIPALQ